MKINNICPKLQIINFKAKRSVLQWVLLFVYLMQTWMVRYLKCMLHLQKIHIKLSSFSFKTSIWHLSKNIYIYVLNISIFKGIIIQQPFRYKFNKRYAFFTIFLYISFCRYSSYFSKPQLKIQNKLAVLKAFFFY